MCRLPWGGRLEDNDNQRRAPHQHEPACLWLSNCSIGASLQQLQLQQQQERQEQLQHRQRAPLSSCRSILLGCWGGGKGVYTLFFFFADPSAAASLASLIACSGLRRLMFFFLNLGRNLRGARGRG